jgi:hypothetical protein
MYPIRFTKRRAAELLQAVSDGRPLPAPPNGWTILEISQAAGALFAAALSHEPPSRWTDKQAFEGLHDEHLELQNERLFDDLHSAIQLHFAVQDGEYDNDYEEESRAIIEHDPDTHETTVKPVSELRSQN